MKFTVDDITAALRQHLPADLHSAIPTLAHILTEISNGTLRAEEAQAQLATNADLTRIFRALAGHQVEAGHSLISFGSSAQMGDVQIGDVAGGNIIKLHINLAPTTINTGGGDYAEGSIDKRQGAFVEQSTVYGDVIGEKHEHYYLPTAPTRSPQEQRNRRAMLIKMRAIWIEGLLEKSLTDELRIELNLVERPDVVDLPLNVIVQELNQPPRVLAQGVPISEVFTQTTGELLILGAPGAGKTTLLLELLRDLLKRATYDEAHPIPIALPLSTWATERKPIREWLVDQLNVIYEVPKRVGREWVDANEVLPLLDGLDEVAQEHRDACVEAINTYRKEIGGLVPTLVCSRITEYEVIQRKLRLRGAVLIEALTQTQVDDYLVRIGEPLRAVRELVDTDPELMELLDSPLMLSVVSLTFRDASPEALRAAGAVENGRSQLWHAYIERMFMRKGTAKRYTCEQTTKRLAWLANQMRRHEQMTFFIEQLQFDWLPSRAVERWYTMLDWGGSLIFGLVVGLVLALPIAWLIGRLTVGLSLGLFIGVFIGVVLPFFGGTSDQETLRQRRTKQVIRDALHGSLVGGGIFGLLGGLVLSLVPSETYKSLINGLYGVSLSAPMGALLGGLLGGITGRPGIKPRRVFVIERLRWSWAKILQPAASGLVVGFTGGMVGGLILSLINELVEASGWNSLSQALLFYLEILISLGLISAVVFGAVFGFVGGLISGPVSSSTRPNRGIGRSLRSAIVGGAAFGLIGGLAGALVIGLGLGLGVIAIAKQSERASALFTVFVIALLIWLLLGLLLGTIGGLIFGGYAYQSHYILRWILARNGSLPFKVIPWLDSCVDRLFLRRVGGGYIFIHRLLMEHFAAMTDEDIARLSGEIEAGRGKQ